MTGWLAGWVGGPNARKISEERDPSAVTIEGMAL